MRFDVTEDGFRVETEHPKDTELARAGADGARALADFAGAIKQPDGGGKCMIRERCDGIEPDEHVTVQLSPDMSIKDVPICHHCLPLLQGGGESDAPERKDRDV